VFVFAGILEISLIRKIQDIEAKRLDKEGGR
jgi:hypothetical protein